MAADPQAEYSFRCAKYFRQVMFKLFKLLAGVFLVIWAISSFTGCSTGYKDKDGKISFNGREIIDKNFVVLSNEFAKDSTTVYYKEHSFQYADVASFEPVDEHYARDKDKVYYCNEYREGQNYYLTKRQTILEVEDADPGSFVTVENGYAKDKDQAYFQGTAIDVKEVASFKSIDPFFAKDDVSAYLNSKVIKGSNGKTFELIDRNFAKDSANIYYYGYTGENQHNIIILPCDRSSFRIMDDRYSKDKSHVFFLGFTLRDADGSSFRILPAGYAADKNFVYFQSKKIPGADASSFLVYPENDSLGHDVAYARDRYTVFMDEKKMPDADLSSFKMLGENYARDSKQVFYKTNIIKNADVATFKVYPHDVGNADAEDATNKYHEGLKVTDD